ncbi:MAG: hypothetical protein GY865_19535 [candidate division Zixibacteria bacterium]|nr:hypothetical protein [candidate division Zixibacteria bacterium]
MNKIKNILSSVLLIGLICTQTANAAVNTEVLFSISGIADMVLIACIVVCLLWSMKIMSLVRGGLMSKGWQMFTLGFVFLLLARLMVLSGMINLFVVPEYVATVFYLLMTVTWLIGIFQTKRTLA